MILFVNACVRDESRTKVLADVLLNKLGDYEEVNLNQLNLKALNSQSLRNRTDYIANGDYENEMFDYARQFASADTIVIAAPFWDLSFPAILKVYLENIYVTGIVSRYGTDGRPVGLCNAKKMYFITSSGGPYIPDYSFNYIKCLANDYFGIKENYLIKAEMLDVNGFDAEEILKKAINSIKEQ